MKQFIIDETVKNELLEALMNAPYKHSAKLLIKLTKLQEIVINYPEEKQPELQEA